MRGSREVRFLELITGCPYAHVAAVSITVPASLCLPSPPSSFVNHMLYQLRGSLWESINTAVAYVLSSWSASLTTAFGNHPKAMIIRWPDPPPRRTIGTHYYQGVSRTRFAESSHYRDAPDTRAQVQSTLFSRLCAERAKLEWFAHDRPLSPLSLGVSRASTVQTVYES